MPHIAPSETPVPDGLLDQATRFHARLADAPRDAALRARFEAWKAEDEKHAAAYTEVERLWGLMGAAIPVVPRRHSLRSWSVGGALAASVALAIFLSPAIIRFSQNLRSDAVAAVGERKSIDLADGSRITLNSDTALAVDMAGEHRAIRLFRGEAFFAVHHDAARPFTVEAGDARVTVLGTRFDVRLLDGQAKVNVEQGLVRFQSPAGQVLLAANEQGLSTGNGIGKVRAPSADATAWRNGRAIFYNASVADVVADLNRYRSGRIILLGSGLAKRRITGNFRTDDPRAGLDALVARLQARTVALPGGIVLLY